MLYELIIVEATDLDDLEPLAATTPRTLWPRFFQTCWPIEDLWVPETLQRPRDLRIFVDQAAESVASDHRGVRVGGHR